MPQLVRRRPDTVYLGGWLAVPKEHVNVAGTKRALEIISESKYGARPRVLKLWRETQYHLWFPRAFWQAASLPLDMVDCRPTSYKHTGVVSNIKLDHRKGPNGLVPTGRTVQRDAIEVMLKEDGGTVQMACGLGKTPTALELIARLQVPAIIVVDNTQLLQQWRDEIDKFLEVPGGVGYIHASKMTWDRGVVLSTYQTLARRSETLPEEVCSHFGVVFWDEGHHLAAETYAKSAPLFYGKRFLLTATAKRDDGLSVVYEMHAGPVIFKELGQELRPRIYFKSTGIGIDETNAAARVRDKRGELHYKLIAGHLAINRDRIALIQRDIDLAISLGRKVLLLSESRSEVINLWATRSRGIHTPLYSDIPYPEPRDIGETVKPAKMDEKIVVIEERIARVKALLKSAKSTPAKEAALRRRLKVLEDRLHRHRVYLKLEAEMQKRQRAYIKEVMEGSHDGLMVYGIPPKKRAWFLAHKQVTFASAKYGREGLDSAELDTIMVSTPFSNRNAMQQLMGRILRVLQGKQKPVLLIYEDAIGMFIGMCTNLRKALKAWPVDEGGPYYYQYIDHPFGGREQCQIEEALGP